MKKVLSIFLALFIFIALISLCSCQKNNNVNIENNVSDKRETLYDVNCEYGYIAYVCGQREQPYETDGKTGKMVDFGLVSFYPKIATSENFDIVFYADEKEIELTLQKNPFDDCLMADSFVRCNNDAKIYVEIEGEKIELSNKSNDYLFDYDKAFKIGTKHFESTIKKLTTSGVFNGEIYVMILFDKINNFENQFWYYAIFDGYKYKSIVISTKTGEILAEK